jgi:hypothetical protein
LYVSYVLCVTFAAGATIFMISKVQCCVFLQPLPGILFQVVQVIIKGCCCVLLQAELGLWAQLLAVRDLSNVSLEKARTDKLIGSSLDAKVLVVLPATGQLRSWVQALEAAGNDADDARYLFIASQVRMLHAAVVFLAAVAFHSTAQHKQCCSGVLGCCGLSHHITAQHKQCCSGVPGCCGLSYHSTAQHGRPRRCNSVFSRDCRYRQLVTHQLLSSSLDCSETRSGDMGTSKVSTSLCHSSDFFSLTQRAYGLTVPGPLIGV